MQSSNSPFNRFRLPALQLTEGEQTGQPEQQVEENEDERGLWGDWTEMEVKAATVMWINSLVIGLDLCPFALESMPGLRVAVSTATEKEQALDVLAEEMGYLVDQPINKPATTLVVFPLDLFDRESFDIDYSPEESEEEEMEKEEDEAIMVPQDPNFVSFMQARNHLTRAAYDIRC